jgi:MFS family permease
VGDTVGGIASDAILRKTGNLNKARRDLVVGGFLCSLVFTIMIFFAHSVALAALSLSAAFFCSEFTIGPLWAIPMDITPEFSGSASGLMNIGSPLAAIVSPLTFGYLIDKTGNWNYPFFGSIFVLLCGSIVAFWVKPEQEFHLRT